VPGNPIRRWAVRAPLWQMFCCFTIVFGGGRWLFQRQELVFAAAPAVLFGAMMTWLLALTRSHDRAASGLGADETAELEPAIEAGEVPTDPRRREAMALLIERRREQWHRQRISGPIGVTVGLVLGVVAVIVSGVWPDILFVAFFVGGEVFAIVQPIRKLRALDRMAALLARDG
jgi:Flp pilus assembly protein TadB